MKRKMLLLFVLFLGFVSFIFNTFAFEANLSVDKDKSDINDYITLEVNISTSTGGEIGITNIKGIDNFDIISQSQSQSSSNSVVIINGKTETKIKTSLVLKIVLKAKNKGDFIIGPAILKRDSEQIETNTVKVSVSGDKLYLNNNHLNISNTVNSPKNNIKKEIVRNEERFEKYENIKEREFNNNSLYIFIGVILLIILGFYLIVKNKPDFFDSKKIIDKKAEEPKHIDFEDKPNEIVYPELSDSDFIDKISDILKIKLGEKYKIKGVKNKTFSEILNEIGESKDGKIYVLIEKLNKAKYSNYIGNNSSILDGVKNI